MSLVYQETQCPSSQVASWHDTNGVDVVKSLSYGARYLLDFLCRDCRRKSGVSWWALMRASARGVVGEAWVVAQWLHSTISRPED